MCVCKKCVHEKKIKMGQGWGCSSSGKAFAKQGPWVPSLATQKKERGKIRTDDSA
jgi:ribosomal protein L37AE/L43A